MNQELITRLINLVRQTGQRVIFGNPETGQTVVIMDLSEYEQLVGINAEATIATPQAVHDHQRPQQNVVQSSATRKSLEALIESDTPVLTARSETKRAESSPIRGTIANLTKTTENVTLNREIGGQKASQGNRHRDEISSGRTPDKAPVNHPATQPTNRVPAETPVAAVGQYEEEERFYLEPLE